MKSLPRWTILAALPLLVTIACRAPDRGRMIDTRRNGDLSEREVRAAVNAHLMRYAGVVEFATFEALESEQDSNVRMALLLWQINGISTCRSAAFLDDPLVAALDCWVLGLQELAYFHSPQAEQAFGASLPLIIERLNTVHGPFEQDVLSRTEASEELKASVDAFVLAHPMLNLSYARESVATEAARITGDPDLTAYAAVGTLDERMQEMSERLNIYALQIPKQMLASAALVKEGVTRDGEVQRLVQDVHGINRNLAHLSIIEERLPALIQSEIALAMESLPTALEPVTLAIESEREEIFVAVAAERGIALREVDRQRTETLAFIETERQALQSTLDETLQEITLLVDRKNDEIETLLNQERQALVANASAIAENTVRQVDEAAEERIEQLALSVLGVGVVLSGVLFLLRALSRRHRKVAA